MKSIASGAKGVHSFSNSLNIGKLPSPSSIEHEGLFYDYYWETLEEKEKHFKANFSSAVSKDPFSGFPEYYIAMGMTGKLDGEGLYKHGGRPALNLVIVLDISGSMNSGFGNGDKQSKLEVAKQSILALLERLNDKDSFSLILFDDQAKVTQELKPWKDINSGELKSKIMNTKTRGGTNIEKGMKAAADQYKNIGQSNNANRVIFLTDMNPNMGSTDEGALLKIVKSLATEKIYTTFIGIGIDFNTALVSTITKIRGSNYFAVKSARDFKKQMNEEFDYMVTVDVFDVSIEFDGEVNGWNVERVYGSPGFEIPVKGRLTFMDSCFPSVKESSTMTKGGIVVIKLKKTSEKSASEIKLKVSYTDADGTKYKDSESVKMPENSQEYYETKSIRKAILLVRYVNFMKQFLYDMNAGSKVPTVGDSGIPIPAPNHKDKNNVSDKKDLEEPYKQVFQKFMSHFEHEMDVIEDKILDKELKQLIAIYDPKNAPSTNNM